MSGIIILLVLSVWFYVVKNISSLCCSSMLSGTKRKIITYRIIFVLFFISPVADEIVGGFQFRALCNTETIIKFDKKKVFGKTVYAKLLNAVDVNNTIVNIRSQTWSYLDVENNEVLLSYKTLHANGGILSNLIEYPEGNRPYTFNGSCGPSNEDKVFSMLNIKKVNKKGEYND